MFGGFVPKCMSVYHMHEVCSWRTGEGIISPQTGATEGFGSPSLSWDLNPDSLEE